MTKTVMTCRRAVIITTIFSIVLIAITMIYKHKNLYQNVGYIDPYQHGDQHQDVNLFTAQPQAVKYKENSDDLSRDSNGGQKNASRTKATKSDRKGYVLAWDFYEGQSSAARNLLGLLHWATTIDFPVVEPCVHNSFFILDHCINEPLGNHTLYFSDYFDVHYWNEKVVSQGFGKQLVPWKEFINNKPHTVIVVYLLLVENVNSTVYIDEQIQQAPGCHKKRMKLTPVFSNKSIDKLDLKIKREVCFKLNYYKETDVQWFNEQIFGNYTDSDIVILFAKWPGSFGGRVYFNNPVLKHRELSNYLRTSQRIIKHSKKYQELFLGNDYIALSFRFVKIAIFLKMHHTPSEKIDQFLAEDCPSQVSKTLEKMKGTRMLALDLGRFGDGNPADIEKDTIYKIIPKVVNIVYGNKWNQTEWEDSFVQATGGINDTGYIALVQKALVVNAACIVKGGIGSMFQKTLIEEYKARVKQPCIREVCKI